MHLQLNTWCTYTFCKVAEILEFSLNNYLSVLHVSVKLTKLAAVRFESGAGLCKGPYHWNSGANALLNPPV